MLSRDDLKALALFESLGDEQLDQLLDRHRESTHQADQVIVMEQDWGESLFLLCDGLAKVRTYTADGDEVVMSLLGAGDVFGEMAALDGEARSADVVALVPLRLIKLRVTPFATLLEKQASFALALAKLEASRLRDLNRRFALQTADATTRSWMPWPIWLEKVQPRMILNLQFLRWPSWKLPSLLGWPVKPRLAR